MKTYDDNVVVAIPNLGTIDTGLAEWLLKVTNHKVMTIFATDTPVDVNRNSIVRGFLETDAQWLLMVDADIVPPDNALDMIYNDKPVCAADARALRPEGVLPLAYTLTTNRQRAATEFNNFAKNNQITDTGLAEAALKAVTDMQEKQCFFIDQSKLDFNGLNRVDATGTGCMLIKREVLEKMPAPWFQWQYNDDGTTKMGEDLSFCLKVNELYNNEGVWWDTRYKCKHMRKIAI